MIRPPPSSTLFPYPPLSRSRRIRERLRAAPAAAYSCPRVGRVPLQGRAVRAIRHLQPPPPCLVRPGRRPAAERDRKSTRLNSSHQIISYAVFCLKKKKTIDN